MEGMENLMCLMLNSYYSNAMAMVEEEEESDQRKNISSDTSQGMGASSDQISETAPQTRISLKVCSKTRNVRRLTFEQKQALELEYSKNQSMSQDHLK